MQAAAEENVGQVELFLNSVPLLSSLTYEQKMELVHAFSEEHYAGECCACCSQGLGLCGQFDNWDRRHHCKWPCRVCVPEMHTWDVP